MIEFQYLYKGLCGLARAHRANTMAGHLGAAVLAGYFFGEEQPDADDKVNAAVETELDRVMLGEELLWFDAEKVGITVPELFEPFPEETPQKNQISSITAALAGNIDKMRQSGHNVIFTSIGVRALRDHPEYATPSIVDGVRRLIEGFNGATPGRGYYGKHRGWLDGNQVTLEDDTNFPVYCDEQEMAHVVIDELIGTASEHRRGFGGLFHIINHAAALIELSRFGYKELAHRGLPAHHYHVRLWRSLPDLEEELGVLRRAEHDPLTPEYWNIEAPSQWSARLTHRIKTLYAFSTLLRFIDQTEKQNQAKQKFLYLMA